MWKTFETNKQRMVSPERWVPNKSTVIASAFCHERVSRLQCREQDPENFLSWGDSAKLRKTTVLEFAEQSTRGVIPELKTLVILWH